MKQKIIKYRVLIVFFVIGTILAGLLLFLKSRGSLTSVKNPVYSEKLPIVSVSKDKVIEALGTPQSEAKWNDQTILNYTPSNSNSRWKDQVFLDSKGNTELVVQQIYSGDSRTKTIFDKQFGKEEILLHGSGSPITALFGYPVRGFAFVAAVNGDEISEIWYFKPMSPDEFAKFTEKYGYSKEAYDPTKSD